MTRIDRSVVTPSSTAPLPTLPSTGRPGARIHEPPADLSLSPILRNVMNVVAATNQTVLLDVALSWRDGDRRFLRQRLREAPAETRPTVRYYQDLVAVDHALADGARVTTRGIELTQSARDVVKAYRPRAQQAIDQLGAFITQNRGRPLNASLVADVKRFVDAHVRYASELPGSADLFQPVLTTFVRGAGDCEDYAVATYAILRAIGVPPERMSVLQVQTSSTDPAFNGGLHVVLSVKLANDSYVIADNMSDRAYSAPNLQNITLRGNAFAKADVRLVVGTSYDAEGATDAAGRRASRVAGWTHAHAMSSVLWS